jgi:2-polyprenyl-6-methoxyphenol hydroxylase-like FAD-dependent oxidoreductase/sugar lactone lactonase YvrE
MQTIDCDVAIVGAGVAGSFLACNLRDSGLNVVVVEASRRIPEINRGDQLAPCTVRMLDAVGALPNFEKRGSIQIRHWKAIGPDGSTVAAVPLEATAPAPHNYILGLPHSLIQEALLETATDQSTVELLRGMRVKSVLKNAAGRVTGIEGDRDRENIRINARLVAGCDGPASLIRRSSNIETDIQTYPFEYLMLTCTRSPEQPVDYNLEVWSREGFGGLFPIGDDNVRCPVQAAPGEMVRWREVGLEQVHAELSQRFPYYSDMQLLDDDLHVFKILLHHAETYVSDGAIVLGDAAHCTPPYYGMGMNMGMRDAYHAAKAIVPALQSRKGATREALLPYEQACRTFNQFVLNSSQTYGAVAAAKHQTMSEIRTALKTSPALDANVMAGIYADYRDPPPSHADPLKIAEQWRGVDAIELQAEPWLDGFGYLESARWREDRFWFVDFKSKRVLTVDLEGNLETITTVPDTPGGLGFLPDGTPLVVSQGNFKVMRIQADGAITEHADLSEFARGAANEMLVDDHGRCYVGHHGFDFINHAPIRQSSIVLISEDGHVAEVADDLTFPNGMALTPDGKTLIVAESFANRLTAFDVSPDGRLSGRRLWAQLGKQWTPDGICLDANGALWVGNPLEGAFIRVLEGGEITHKVVLDEQWAVAPALGGPERKTLFGLCAATNMEDMPKGIAAGNIQTVKVDCPGAGLP